MLILKILLTVAYIGLTAYYALKICRFYARAEAEVRNLCISVEEKLKVWKYVYMRAPLFEGFYQVCGFLLVVFWIWG